jgi:hypothetical protein
MKKYILIFSIAFASCNNEAMIATQEKDSVSKHEHSEETPGLNQGKKWKSDEPTRQNVNALSRIINDSSFADPSKRKELSVQLQSGVDTLIKQCRMKGPDHDALHTWLETVLKDIKELKEDDEDYAQAKAKLKTDIDRFYILFE